MAACAGDAGHDPLLYLPVYAAFGMAWPDDNCIFVPGVFYGLVALLIALCAVLTVVAAVESSRNVVKVVRLYFITQAVVTGVFIVLLVVCLFAPHWALLLFALAGAPICIWFLFIKAVIWLIIGNSINSLSPFRFTKRHKAAIAIVELTTILFIMTGGLACAALRDSDSSSAIIFWRVCMIGWVLQSAWTTLVASTLISRLAEELMRITSTMSSRPMHRASSTLMQTPQLLTKFKFTARAISLVGFMLGALFTLNAIFLPMYWFVLLLGLFTSCILCAVLFYLFTSPDNRREYYSTIRGIPYAIPRAFTAAKVLGCCVRSHEVAAAIASPGKNAMRIFLPGGVQPGGRPRADGRILTLEAIISEGFSKSGARSGVDATNAVSPQL